MPQKKETAHDKFLRLMQKRLGRALEELRLVRQLSSKNYESTVEERREVVQHLDDAVHAVARTFEVPFESKHGLALEAARSARPAPAAITAKQVAEIYDLLDCGRLAEAMAILRTALPQDDAHE